MPFGLSILKNSWFRIYIFFLFFVFFFFFFHSSCFFCMRRVPAVAPDSCSQQTAQRRVSLSSVLPQFNNSHVSSESGFTEGLDVPPTIMITVEFPVRLRHGSSGNASVSRGTEDTPEAHELLFFYFFLFSVLLMCELTLFRSYIIGSSPGTECRPSSSSFGRTISV